jgi:hypothetical protein
MPDVASTNFGRQAPIESTTPCTSSSIATTPSSVWSQLAQEDRSAIPNAILTQLTNSPTPTAASTLQSAAHGLACSDGAGIDDQTISTRRTHRKKAWTALRGLIAKRPPAAGFDARSASGTR